ncbi:cuticle protein 19.8 [Galendromus occidentalis]|uniref:Cuticle protein 19.8 n=1 Tax=Galendromus occidentalis TaxID=34638 RepID=A0AAJ7L3V9_9ACAR|nr:cuticle protein 19.8 [Galendromus occidentalis]
MFKLVVAASVAVAAHAGAIAAPAYGGYGLAAPALAAPAYGYASAHAAPLAYAAAAPVVAKAAIAYPPQPYQFGYDSVDEYGTKQSRHEVSDAHNNKKGSYSFTDARGVARQVDYVADALGFRATIKTNEPGTAPSAPAAALYNAAPIAVKTIAAAPVLAKVAAAPIAAYAHAPAYGHSSQQNIFILDSAMFAKIVVASVAIAAANAGAIAAPAYGGYGFSAPLAYAAAAPVVAKAAIAYAPQPYQFGYDSVDEYGTKQSRHEVSDAHNNKKGSYSFTDARGVARQVDYVADALGFRATIKTNEPGTAPSAPAAALYNAAPIAVKTIAAAPVLAKVAAAPIAAYAHAPVYGHGSSYGHY